MSSPRRKCRKAPLLRIGAHCNLIAVTDGAHGMGGWDKLGTDYKQQMTVWLSKALK